VLDKSVEGSQQGLEPRRIAFQLAQGQTGRFQRGQLVSPMGFADTVARRRNIAQSQAWQLLQRRALAEHLAAFAPSAVEDDQAQARWGLQPCGRWRGWGWGARMRGSFLKAVRVQQQRVLAVRRPGRRRKGLTDNRAAVRQAEVKQAGTAFGLVYLQRVP